MSGHLKKKFAKAVAEANKDCGCNVGETERLISAFTGGLLLMKGLRRGSPLGLAMAAMGAGGLYRAATGYCPMYKALGVNTNTPGQKLSNVAEAAKDFGSEKLATVADTARKFTADARNAVSDAIAAR
jgi:hypothetical protein